MLGLLDRLFNKARFASQLPAVPRQGQNLRRVSAADYGEIRQAKLALCRGVGAASSIRDFGGLYLVHGLYLLETALAAGAQYASMVDVTPVPEFADAVAAARARAPSLVVEYQQGDFRNPALFTSLRPVEVSILFEVLLHQENYVEVIRNVVQTTTRAVCVAQPCLRELLFPLPDSVACVQFYPEELKARLREGSFWPKDPFHNRFYPAVWMWGQTLSHLITIFSGFGWGLAEGSVVDSAVCGRYWEYPLLRFQKQD